MRKSKLYFTKLWKNKNKNKKNTYNPNKKKIREHQRSIQSKKSAANAATDSLDFPQLDGWLLLDGHNDVK